LSTGITLTTALHFGVLNKNISFSIPVKDLLKMGLLLASSFGAGWVLREMYVHTTTHFIMFIFVLFVLVIFYCFQLFLLRFITKDELRAIPFLQRWMN